MKETNNNLRIVEGVESTWHYHLQTNDQNSYTSLCGAKVFSTHIPLRNWGKVGHLKERYCDNCKQIATRLFLML